MTSGLQTWTAPAAGLVVVVAFMSPADTSSGLGAGPVGACCLTTGDCQIETSGDCASAGGTYLGDGSECPDCSFVNCAQPDANCQEPDITNFPGGLAPLRAEPTIDNFTATATSIDKVCFWGAYIDLPATEDCASGVTDTWRIKFYDNVPGIPPQPDEFIFAQRFHGQMTVNARPTGMQFNFQNFSQPVDEYEFTADFDNPVTGLTIGECYWIEILNLGPVPNCEWHWELSPEFANDPQSGDGDGHAVNTDPRQDLNFDMAFCLDSDLGDVQDCYIPIFQGCDTGTGPCNEANGTPGCEDPDCCTLVCADVADGGAGLAVCCLTPWAQFCADKAIELGCAPLPPCQPQENCQEVGVLEAFGSIIAPGAPESVVADDFTPANTTVINSICWYGAVQLIVSNPQEFANDFRVTYYADDEGLPGTILTDVNANPASYTQSGAGNLQLANVTEEDSNLEVVSGDTILVYTATHADVPVTAGECYWIEIVNDVPPAMGGQSDIWFWSLARDQSTDPLFEGNGRVAVDGDGITPPNGYDDNDVIAVTDMAFCLGIDLQIPVCGLMTLYNTGPEFPVFWDSSNSSNYLSNFYLGWSSGYVDSDFPSRRTAQPFTLGPVAEGGGTDHRIRFIYVDGAENLSATNDDLNFEIFARSGSDRPEPADSLVTGSFPFSAIFNRPNPEGGSNDPGLPPPLHYINVDFALPPGDYWLTIWASNSTEGVIPAIFSWFTNAHDGIKVTCPGSACIGPAPEFDASPAVFGCDAANCGATSGDVIMWRSAHYPDGADGDPAPSDGFGFGSYSLDTMSLAWDPIDDPVGGPDNLYSASFQLRGTQGGTCGNSILEGGEECDPPGAGCNSVCRITGPPPCPWDCDGSNDGYSNVLDLLALIGQYDPGAPTVCAGGAPCDFDADGCVSVTDLLKLLGEYSVLPDGSSCGTGN